MAAPRPDDKTFVVGEADCQIEMAHFSISGLALDRDKFQISAERECKEIAQKGFLSAGETNELCGNSDKCAVSLNLTGTAPLSQKSANLFLSSLSKDDIILNADKRKNAAGILGAEGWRLRGAGIPGGRFAQALLAAKLMSHDFGSSKSIDWLGVAAGASYLVTVPLAGSYSSYYAGGPDHKYSVGEKIKFSKWSTTANMAILLAPVIKNGLKGLPRSLAALSVVALQGMIAYPMCREASDKKTLLMPSGEVFTECGEAVSGFLFSVASWIAFYEPDIDMVDYKKLLFRRGLQEMQFCYREDGKSCAMAVDESLQRIKLERNQEWQRELKNYDECVKNQDPKAPFKCMEPKRPSP